MLRYEFSVVSLYLFHCIPRSSSGSGSSWRLWPGMVQIDGCMNSRPVEAFGFLVLFFIYSLDLVANTDPQGNRQNT